MARAEGYGGTLYQRAPADEQGRRRLARALVALAAFLVVAAAGAGSAGAVPPTEFRVAYSEYHEGLSTLTVVAPAVFGQEPPPAERIQVLDSVDKTPVEGRAERLPRAPLEVVLVVDVSGGPGTIESIQGGLREFVLSLPDGTAVAVVSAGEQPHLEASLTRSRASALAGVALLSPRDPGLPEAVRRRLT